ncbi:hypothetical protein GmHk_02G004476 [Glycine max]|nr:hypothetical protein GmHk_02G004476 [Glycine max]
MGWLRGEVAVGDEGSGVNSPDQKFWMLSSSEFIGLCIWGIGLCFYILKDTSKLLYQTFASYEQYFVFGNMHGFSPVDGFVEISNCLAEVIKYVGNESSTGLFFIQHHTQNAVPNVIKLKNNIIDKSHETTLHTEDLEDSVSMVRSMKECGFPIADEMIGDIKKSLAMMTTKHPKGRLIHRLTANSTVYSQEGSEIRPLCICKAFQNRRLTASSGHNLILLDR